MNWKVSAATMLKELCTCFLVLLCLRRLLLRQRLLESSLTRSIASSSLTTQALLWCPALVSGKRTVLGTSGRLSSHRKSKLTPLLITLHDSIPNSWISTVSRRNVKQSR
eukprot:Rmarinus@m.7805